MNRKAVVRLDRLRKTYGSTVAVDDLSFDVYEGEVFGVVGPNGAGKTTALECIEGMRRPDAGTVQVLGLDQPRQANQIRRLIGIQFQEASLQARIKVWEVLDLFASFYGRQADWRRVLCQLGLADKAKTCFARLSGGQKKRLFVALALINEPRILFLDEVTAGLDPQARRAMWDLIKGLRDAGRTVLLTTHYMDEAERLCDRVVFVDKGRVMAIGAPQELARDCGRDGRLDDVFLALASPKSDD